MKIIIPQAPLISKILGEQSKKDSNYRLLNFCILKKAYDGVALLYNDLTKELLALDSDEAEIIEDKSYSADNDFVNTLIKKWFLVPETSDDLKLSNQILSLARAFDVNKGIKDYIILTTTACNARCYYCFEAGARTTTMTADTAKAVADYIVSNCSGEKVNIRWFGGEPLCNTAAIDIISQILTENNVKFSSNIVTNGFLIDEKLAEKANKFWKLKNAQITLDGTKDIYNRIKNYVTECKNPYEKVLNNIGLFLENGISVNVRLNLDSHNKEDLYLLVDELHERFGEKDNFSINTHVIFNAAGYVNKNRTLDDNKELSNHNLELQAYIASLNMYGTRYLSRNIKIRQCMADSQNAVLISPEGKLGCCEHHIDDDFFGDIFKRQPKKSWCEYKPSEEKCKTCPVQPSCIRLKDCHPEEEACYDYLQNERIVKKERLILEEYKRFVKKGK